MELCVCAEEKLDGEDLFMLTIIVREKVHQEGHGEVSESSSTV